MINHLSDFICRELLSALRPIPLEQELCPNNRIQAIQLKFYRSLSMNFGISFE